MTLLLAPLVLGGIIAAAGSLIGGAMSSASNSSNTNKSNKFNQDEAEKNRAWQEAMWNKQNEYNSPLQQVNRLKAAGLNPNLVYGNGSMQNTAASVGSGAQASAAPNQPDAFGPSLAQATQQYYNIATQEKALEEADARIDNLAMQNTKIAADAELSRAKVQTENQTRQPMISKLINETNNLKIQANKFASEIESMEQDIKGKKVDNEYKKKLYEKQLEHLTTQIDSLSKQMELIPFQKSLLAKQGRAADASASASYASASLSQAQASQVRALTPQLLEGLVNDNEAKRIANFWQPFLNGAKISLDGQTMENLKTQLPVLKQAAKVAIEKGQYTKAQALGEVLSAYAGFIGNAINNVAGLK